MFKIGDKVRRKESNRDDAMWPYGDRVLEVFAIEPGTDSLRFEGCEEDVAWYRGFFDAVVKNRVVEAMVSAKVGPFKVRVWVNVDPATPLTEVRAAAVQNLLVEVDDNYRDPDIGHDDTIVRLQDLLEKREDVAAYEIMGTDGCGVVVYPDWR